MAKMVTVGDCAQKISAFVTRNNGTDYAYALFNERTQKYVNKQDLTAKVCRQLDLQNINYDHAYDANTLNKMGV